jgi:hypothetical protein
VELILSLLFLGSVMAGYAFVIPWAVRTLRRPPSPPVRSLAADEPSGPIVPAADLLPAVWIADVDRRHPEPWWIGHRHHIALRPFNPGAVCDRTAVDEVRRVTEEVAG